MAKNKKSNASKSIEDAMQLNKAFSDGFKQLSNIDTTASHHDELVRMDNEVNELIRSELNNTKSITSDDMSTFLVKVFNDMEKNGVPVKSMEDIFGADDEGLIQFFQDRYRNRNMYYEDLNVICEQLYEMEEAIMTTRDAIITADDISQTVSRSISFKDTATGVDVDSYKQTVEEIETRLGLPKKIKNQIIPNTLKYGTYYVYTIPYSKLFEQQHLNIQKDLYRTGTQRVREAFVSENFDNELATELRKIDDKLKDNTITAMKESIYDNISVLNDVCSIPLVEGVDVSGIYSDDKFRKAADDEIKDSMNDSAKYADAVYNKIKEESFEGTVKDCYIRFLDPRRVIPIKILDTTLGYYYVHESQLRINKAPFSNTIRVTNSTAPGLPSEDIEAVFLSKITDKIVASFDKKFVQNNAKFKDLILNSLIYNDIYNKQLTFQFIPRDYMVEFTVNEDENGEGQSVLKRSLFYAKLYLALLIFKMVSIINRSNDTRIYYIRNSGIDSNIINSVQDAARSLKGRQINFMDLLNYNSIISRIGHNKELFIPTGRSGEKSIDFDILQGQDIPLNTELMEMLRTNMINGTGVPSVIMNYINEADYAKTIQMGHAKFVGRAVSNQLDFNPQLTELYQKILKYSGAQIPEDYIDKLIYTLNPPKTLNNINSADILSVADQIVSAIVKAMVGDTANDDESAIVRDEMYNSLMKDYLPMINWSRAEDVHKAAVLAAQTKLNNASNDE